MRKGAHPALPSRCRHLLPLLLHWRQGDAELTIRQALEPWPLLCDTPAEGGSTSRFVDSSLRRFELIGTAALRQRYALRLQGRPLPWPADPQQPLAVRFRQEALFPCLHPCLPVHVPLDLELLEGEAVVGRWCLRSESVGFEPHTQEPTAPPREPLATAPLLSRGEHCCTVDLRF